MSAVTFADAGYAAGVPFTVADLEATPDDGRRYELLDGVLVVSPRPTTVHLWVATKLVGVLLAACPEDLGVVAEPALQLTSKTELAPDIVVVRTAQVGGAKFTEPPLLVVEVRSPSTALIDLNRKKGVYEKFGVQSYWIVDPDLEHPELTVFGLRDGHYVTEAKTTQPVLVDRPFAVTINPAVLTKGLRRE
jgi:Uma2 family endonuclease